VTLFLVSLAALAVVVAAPGHGQTAQLGVTVDAGVLRLVDGNGAPVERLAPGQYAIAVLDGSNIHNVHLEGPGVSRDSGLAFVGTTTWTVTLTDGVHTIVSDPQADSLALRVVVGTPPDPTLVASVTDGAIALRRPDGGAVTQLEPGRYAIAVEDSSASESFRLLGPGVSRHTQRHVASRTIWYVELADGVYHYFSDRRPTALRGSVRVGTGASPAPTNELRAVTGSDFAIALVGADFAPVAQLRPGRYTIAVDDRSPDHNFRLRGRGLDAGTTLPEVGMRTLTVTLSAGEYAFLCDPHTQTMLGGVVVRAPAVAARRLAATLTAAGRSVLADAAGRPVRRLSAGLYDLRVRDASRRSGFRLSGPGVRRSTGVHGNGHVAPPARPRNVPLRRRRSGARAHGPLSRRASSGVSRTTPSASSTR
jgi:hypothetical protein